MTFVYFIREEGTHWYKIGQSYDPYIRLYGIQTGNWRRLKIEAVTPIEPGDELLIRDHFVQAEKGVGEWRGHEDITATIESGKLETRYKSFTLYPWDEDARAPVGIDVPDYSGKTRRHKARKVPMSDFKRVYKQTKRSKENYAND